MSWPETAGHDIRVQGKLIQRNERSLELARPARMSATSIAKCHLEAALAEGEAEGVSADALARAMLSQVIVKFLTYRSVADVKAELTSAAENCDPDTDYPFIRP